MQSVLWAMAILACPAGMGAMMWLMMRGGASRPPRAGAEQELTELRAEVERLKADQPAHAGAPR